MKIKEHMNDLFANSKLLMWTWFRPKPRPFVHRDLSTYIERVLEENSDKYIFFVVRTLREKKAMERFISYRGLAGEVKTLVMTAVGWSDRRKNAVLICTTPIYNLQMYIQLTNRLRAPDAKHYVWVHAKLLGGQND
jgi:hypothetical protein